MRSERNAFRYAASRGADFHFYSATFSLCSLELCFIRLDYVIITQQCGMSSTALRHASTGKQLLDIITTIYSAALHHSGFYQFLWPNVYNVLLGKGRSRIKTTRHRLNNSKMFGAMLIAQR